jgi:hypothetical protein
MAAAEARLPAALAVGGPTIVCAQHIIRDTCRRNGWDAEIHAALASALAQVKACSRGACVWAEFKDARIAALQLFNMAIRLQ